ncbi:cysteate racemase [Sphingomonas nostoxanthinifaciens]|uniref:aspartate/glutamate racemase family protein n=1 Tax=Sphingomonas nostoxanthinifaciens TaxID=2872652 RepID=UPI001CC1CD5B|nr:amino acid racemase [Sphingomonas nostoxanthinifaciens]UAK25045.1 amino acid racemase [Sphingomonas nostoxanthinifaciens]
MDARIVGVLGGMGPAATIDFMAKVLRHSQAARGPGSREQEDVRLLVDSNPAVPDRNAAVAGTGPSPGPALAAMAQGLAGGGAAFLVMPCNAAHAFADAIVAATPLPFVSLIAETAQAIRADFPAIERVGVLAVDATARARLYEQALEPLGIAPIVPEGAARARFMETVWRIKAGDTGDATRAAMRASAEALIADGAQLIVAGCTEVPLALGPGDLAVPFLDATDILARRTVAYARGEALPAR